MGVHGSSEGKMRGMGGFGIDRYINHEYLSTCKPVSLHFNQAGHSINDVHLIPIELIRSKRDSVRKAREAHLINKAKTLPPFGLNRKDEPRQWHLLTPKLPIILLRILFQNFYL